MKKTTKSNQIDDKNPIYTISGSTDRQMIKIGSLGKLFSKSINFLDFVFFWPDISIKTHTRLIRFSSLISIQNPGYTIISGEREKKKASKTQLYRNKKVMIPKNSFIIKNKSKTKTKTNQDS